jgi:hypothetical protein
MSKRTEENERTVLSVPGRLQTRDPFSSTRVVADSAELGTGRPKALYTASTLRNSSADCL